MDEESSHFNGELVLFFSALLAEFSSRATTAGHAAASAEVTSTDRSGFTETDKSAH